MSIQASISERHGFKHESYNITTEDGIRTPIYRILPRNKSIKHNTPVFIQHGLQMDATVWVSIGNRSLGKNFNTTTLFYYYYYYYYSFSVI